MPTSPVLQYIIAAIKLIITCPWQHQRFSPNPKILKKVLCQNSYITKGRTGADRHVRQGPRRTPKGRSFFHVLRIASSLSMTCFSDAAFQGYALTASATAPPGFRRFDDLLVRAGTRAAPSPARGLPVPSEGATDLHARLRVLLLLHEALDVLVGRFVGAVHDGERARFPLRPAAALDARSNTNTSVPQSPRSPRGWRRVPPAPIRGPAPLTLAASSRGRQVPVHDQQFFHSVPAFWRIVGVRTSAPPPPPTRPGTRFSR